MKFLLAMRLSELKVWSGNCKGPGGPGGVGGPGGAGGPRAPGNEVSTCHGAQI